MNRTHSIILLLMFLFLSTSCEDDYRSMVFFSGDKPIYQVGTCTNLISNITLRISSKEGAVVGIDGGDGNYTYLVDDDNIVKIEETDAAGGYRHICIKPQALGEVSIIARDGSGNQAILFVSVAEPKIRFKAMAKKIEFVNQQLLTEEEVNRIGSEQMSGFPVNIGGGFEIHPDENGSYENQGNLQVYVADEAGTVLSGTYLRKDVTWQGKKQIAFDFTFEEKTHTYIVENKLVNERSIGQNYLLFREDVTFACGALPDEVKVYRLLIVDARSL